MTDKPKCKRCNDTGVITFTYRDVAEASGLFYDRDIVYELRTIRKPCPVCQKRVQT